MSASIIKDLQQLVAAKVISEETAARIEAYYQSRAAQPTNRFAIVLGILGALLVGLGIVLVVAHNWDDFGKLPKTIFAFIPLVLGQVLCLYTLLKKKDFTWQESSAVILCFGVAACIALISQIYHLGGSLTDFLLTWMLLVVALMYIMPSRITGLLYLAGITWYACLKGYGFEEGETPPYLYLPLLTLVLPMYLQLWRRRNESDLLALYNWFAVASFVCVLASFTEGPDFVGIIALAYVSLFCVFYMVGTNEFYRQKRLHSNPYLFAAIVGILIIFMSASFQGMDLGDEDYFFESISWNSSLTYMIILLMGLTVFMIVKRVRQEGLQGVGPVELSAFIYLLYMALPNEALVFRQLLINVWILVIAIYYIRKGSQQQHLGILNLGLLIIAALAIFRFFDDAIPFVWRGIFFLVAGIGFFAANYIVIKKKRSLDPKQSA